MGNKKNISINSILTWTEKHIILSMISIILIIAMIIAGFSLYLKLFEGLDNHSDWASFYGGLIGGIIGAIGTIIAMLITTIQAKNQQKENLNLTRSIQEDNRQLTIKMYETNKSDIQIRNLNEVSKDLREKLRNLNNCYMMLNEKSKLNVVYQKDVTKLIKKDLYDFFQLIINTNNEFYKKFANVSMNEIKSLEEDLLEEFDKIKYLVNELIFMYGNLDKETSIFYKRVESVLEEVNLHYENAISVLNSLIVKSRNEVIRISNKKYKYISEIENIY